MILCCKCGIPTEPSLLNMCNRCISTELDITKKIPRHVTIEHCRQCDRYLNPPGQWQSFATGSPELLALLLRKAAITQQIANSELLPTEPHSKRLAIRVSVLEDGISQEVKIIFRICNKQCPACVRVEAKKYWHSLVQVRHRGRCKRTLLLLEQLLLRSECLRAASNIKPRDEGIDFYFQDRPSALKLVSFVQHVLISRVKKSERLMSRDVHSSHSDYKYTYSVELAPICKDDLLLLDDTVANKLGISQIVLVIKVGGVITVVDPLTLRTAEITNKYYWTNQQNIKVIMDSKDLVRYQIVDIERSQIKNGKYCLGDAYVTKDNEKIIHCKTHLGNIIKEGDEVLVYDIQDSNMNFELNTLFRVFIVRKVSKPSKYRLKSKQKSSKEEEYFIEDLMDDHALMQKINLYDDEGNLVQKIEETMNLV
ncbi:60S ribosomal export protein nmd3 [Astathelohania contejeani]|uniref:60S ribosomal export protein NMD3 n=1 Tax=Astathelohania contejeani TaxID=164912 RepID=A0ABQ7HW69_9MICR|nr:60S ribosomal export protein nmd3 [Thelohania contejeani]